MHQNVPVPRFKLSSFSHFVTTASSYPKVRADGKNIPQELRMCPLCKSGEEDENHFLWSCSAFSGIRVDLLNCAYIYIIIYVSIPKFSDMAYNDRTLLLLGAPSVELEPET